MSGTVTRHPLWPTWEGMIRRCSDSAHVAYHRYGGRGISVCDRWRNDFLAFVADMGERPTGRTLNRIDNDGNYEPGNCCWSDSFDQARNRAPLRVFEFNGLTMTLAHWAKKTGISQQALRKRIRLKWPIERVLTEPMKTSSPELMRLASSRAGKAVPASKRGFTRNPDLASLAGSLGGAAVPAEKRSFSANRELAAIAGARGGAAVPAEKRTFSLNHDLSVAAGKLGGKTAHRRGRNAY